MLILKLYFPPTLMPYVHPHGRQKSTFYVKR